MNDNVAELAQQPADEALLKRAREVCAARVDLVDELHALLTSNPTRASVHAFIERAKATLPSTLIERVDMVCNALKIMEPTGQERLLALQVLLMNDQAQAGQQLIDTLRASKKLPEAQGASSTASYLLTGLVLGALAGTS